MKNLVISSLVLSLGLLLGAAIGRGSTPAEAVAQTTAPMQGAMPMTSSMPMGTSMPMRAGHGTMMNCPAYQSMMQHAHSPADRALMQSMMSMHQSMQSMHLTGDADRDFLVMMIPHHQMAVAMAKTELQYGKDSKVMALARSIIAAQQKEIAEMQTWLR